VTLASVSDHSRRQRAGESEREREREREREGGVGRGMGGSRLVKATRMRLVFLYRGKDDVPHD